MKSKEKGGKEKGKGKKSKKGQRAKNFRKRQINQPNQQVKSVIFIPYTPESEVGKKWRENDKINPKKTRSKS